MRAWAQPRRLRMRWRHDMLERGVVELPLGGFHADPADRFIVAAAQALGATLLTADERILRWPGPLERHDARL